MDDIIEQTLFENRYEDFISDIEKIHNDGQNCYMDSVVHYCTTNGVELECAASLINRNTKLKELIREEAENLHFFSKTSKLPI